MGFIKRYRLLGGLVNNPLLDQGKKQVDVQ